MIKQLQLATKYFTKTNFCRAEITFIKITFMKIRLVTKSLLCICHTVWWPDFHPTMRLTSPLIIMTVYLDLISL